MTYEWWNLQASKQLNLQYNLVGMEIWNLKGYTNYSEPNPPARGFINWLVDNREKYFTKVPFDDILLFS